jgi:protein-S-isoprenylcysteine O-methyltransferase Ste14
MKYLQAFRYFLIPVLVLVGLPLLGWGIDDFQGFLSIYPRLGLVFVAVALGLPDAYQVIKGREPSDPIRRGESRTVRRQSVVFLALVFLLLGSLFFLPFADRRGIAVMMAGQAFRWPGLILCGLGFALMAWSRAALGRMHSGHVTIQKDHELITTGPYRTIRHPIYLGILCTTLGLALLFRSWLGLAVMIPIVSALLFRIRDEEAVLHKEFGPEWEAYCKRSWRFIPYLY